MTWAGPLATAALVVVACSGELALEEVADGVEFEPHAATITATTAPIMTGSAFDLVEFVLKKRFLPNGAFTMEKKLTRVTVRNRSRCWRGNGTCPSLTITRAGSRYGRRSQ